jgi:hypothetical protein
MELFDDDDDDAVAFASAAAAVATATAAVATLTAQADFLRQSMMNTRLLLEELEEDESSSDEEEFRHGGSLPGKTDLKRDFEGANNTLFCHYFGDAPFYSETQFERRFGMPRAVFSRVFDELKTTDAFKRKFNPVNHTWGIFPLNKFCCCLRVLVYGEASDKLDEYFQIAESTAAEYLIDFCALINHLFGDYYLNRCPTPAEKERVLALNMKRGFPGMFASWDCKHFDWHKCPTKFAGQYKGKEKAKTLILEAISDPDLYIWYCHFGEPGSLNDLNVLDKSSIVLAINNQSFDTKVETYIINGRSRDYLYFLADGIYPNWSILCKTIPHPTTAKESKYAQRHEHVRKDVERFLGF